MQETTRIQVGSGRTRVHADVYEVGADRLVLVGGEGLHIGAASLAERVAGEATAVRSVVARVRDNPERWHKEKELTDRVAERLTETTGRLTLAVSGIHLDRITPEEIEAIRANVAELTERLVVRFGNGDKHGA